ncbi:MAG: nucleotidyltransferase substrate binding protein [Moraxella sp.]|nr:nucleotidyltransferase substrate binding protein [Moraxella sp.]
MNTHDNIIITPLVRAIGRLSEGLARYRLDVSDEQIRDGLIQRFEFTYELSHKTLKRYLQSTSPSPQEFDGMAFAQLIRMANKQGLLKGDWTDWQAYREARNLTSHTYHEATALKVVAMIPKFLAESEYLVERLQVRLTGHATVEVKTSE